MIAARCQVCGKGGQRVGPFDVTDGGAKVHTSNGRPVDALRVIACGTACAVTAIWGFGPRPRGSTVARAPQGPPLATPGPAVDHRAEPGPWG